MALNTLLQFGVALPGLTGTWYTAPTLGMSCNTLCSDLGGHFDATASQHNGTASGAYFHPANEDLRNGLATLPTVECSTAAYNYAANGERPSGWESSPECYVHCACTDVALPELQINFQPSTVALTDWLADAAYPFMEQRSCEIECNGPISTTRYGWLCGNVDDFGTFGYQVDFVPPRGYNYLEMTGVVPDWGGGCPMEEWNLEVPEGTYEVQVIIQDIGRGLNASGCTLEGMPLSLGFVPAGVMGTANLTVRVSDGNLTFAGSYHAGCEQINRIIIKRKTVRVQRQVTLSGDYSTLIGARSKEAYLAACSAALAPVDCDDLEEGSVVLTLGVNDNEEFLQEVARDVESVGLEVDGFPTLVAVEVTTMTATTTTTSAVTMVTGPCSVVSPDDLRALRGVQCFAASSREEQCQVSLESAPNLTCNDWCKSQGRTALTEGWQCSRGWENFFNRPPDFLGGLARRLDGRKMNNLVQEDCFEGFDLGCSQPSGHDHLVCQCEDASPVVDVESLAEFALNSLLSNFSNISGTNITIADENAIVTAIVLTTEAAEMAGGSLAVTLAGTLAAVDIPVSAISKYGDAVIAVVAAYSPRTVDANQSLLDSGNNIIPFLGQPVSVQLASTTGQHIPVVDLEDPIIITVPRPIVPGVAWNCGFFDDETTRWTTDGVGTDAMGPELLVCSTRHLTLFAAIARVFADTLRCSNAFLLSSEGIEMIGRGSWAYEPAAIFLWLVCAFQLILCAGAARFDLRAKGEGLWSDEDFLCEKRNLTAIPEDGTRMRSGKSSRFLQTLQEKRKELPRWGELKLWLRAQINAYCIKQIVAYRMWIAPRDMQSLLEWLDAEEEQQEQGGVSASTTTASAGTAGAISLFSILRSPGPNTRAMTNSLRLSMRQTMSVDAQRPVVLADAEKETTTVQVESEVVAPAAISASEVEDPAASVPDVPPAVQRAAAAADVQPQLTYTTKVPEQEDDDPMTFNCMREQPARTAPLPLLALWWPSFCSASSSMDASSAFSQPPIVVDSFPQEPPAQVSIQAPPALQEPTTGVEAHPPACTAGAPEPDLEMCAIGKEENAHRSGTKSTSNKKTGSKSTNNMMYISRTKPAMKQLARPLKEELEKHHEEYFLLRTTHRYAAGVLCFGLQPWLSLYRYSIFDSCIVRALHLTAEVSGALMFSAFFFGIDAVSVTSPPECDSGGIEEELWSELAAAFLGSLFAASAVGILKLLGRRGFKELPSRQAIELQLWRWRMQDIIMWIIGLSYIIFCLSFVVVFLANTKVSSGLSFLIASCIEELLMSTLVPIFIAVAYLVLDLTAERKEEDYIKAKELVGLRESRRSGFLTTSQTSPSLPRAEVVGPTLSI